MQAENSVGSGEGGASGTNFESQENFEANAVKNAGNSDLTNIIDELNQQNKANEAQTTDTAPPAQAQAPSPMESAPSASLAPPPQPLSSGGGLVGGAAGNPAGPGLPEIGSKLAYIVQAKDTLGKISQKIYGKRGRYRDLATWSNIENPNKIYPGDVVYYQLTQESLGFAQAYENIQRSEVVVAEGDTLGSIASKVYGNGTHWKFLWRHNDGITDPDLLTVGMTVYYVPVDVLAQQVSHDEVLVAQKQEIRRAVNFDKLVKS